MTSYMDFQGQDFVGEIRRRVVEKAQESAGDAYNAIQFHNGLLNRIVDLADDYKLKGMPEFEVKALKSRGRKWRLDVAWFRKTNRVHAVFEIDSSLRKKSIDKILAHGHVDYRFFVYYGPKKDEVESFLRENAGNQIHCICVTKRLKVPMKKKKG